MTTTDEERLHPGWSTHPDVPDGFPEMIEALRVLQDRVTAAAPPPDLVAHVTAAAADLSARLAAHAVDESRQVVGHVPGVPGRGDILTPVLVADSEDGQRITGRARFGRYYLGGNGAVHGGAIPLLFDDLMGRLAHTGGRRPARTAYLHVDYRSITPIERELRVAVWFESEQGRKRLLRGTLHHGDTLCVEASGLFVELRPGQP